MKDTTKEENKTDKNQVDSSKKNKTEKKTEKRHLVKSKKEKNHKNEFCEIQAVAAIGVALVAMSEDIGGEMCQRIFGHMV